MLELFEALAETPPRAYLQRTPSGQSLLRQLYQQAAEADLVARSAPDDIARLHALFDVALDHGLGGLVRDYLTEVKGHGGLQRWGWEARARAASHPIRPAHPQPGGPGPKDAGLPTERAGLGLPCAPQVCSDRLLTSSDPVEAFLLDAECVRRWVQKLLAVSRGRLASWLARGLSAAAPGGSGGAGERQGCGQGFSEEGKAAWPGSPNGKQPDRARARASASCCVCRSPWTLRSPGCTCVSALCAERMHLSLGALAPCLLGMRCPCFATGLSVVEQYCCTLLLAGVTAKELGRLQMLQLIAEALANQSGAAPPAAAADGTTGSAAGGGSGTAQAGAAPAEPAELAEACRLAACARVLAWLGQAGSGFDRPAGRFFSEQEWRSVAAKRREGASAAGVGGLFLADLAAELVRQGLPEATLAYPPPTPDRLLSALFLAPPTTSSSGSGAGASALASGPAGKPASSKAAGAKAAGEGEAAAAAAPAGQDARLALLAYYLADGGFVAPGAIVQGLQ